MKKKIFILSLFLMVVVLGIAFGNNQLDVQKNDTVLPLPANRAKKIASPDDRGAFIIWLHSSGHSRHPPADLLIENSEGLKTGHNPITGVNYSEIPKSYYESIGLEDAESGDPGPTTKELAIGQPIAGDYELYVIGTDTGTYTLEIRAYDPELNRSIREYEDISINQGEIHTYDFYYPKTVGADISIGFDGKGQRKNGDAGKNENEKGRP